MNASQLQLVKEEIEKIESQGHGEANKREITTHPAFLGNGSRPVAPHSVAVHRYSNASPSV